MFEGLKRLFSRQARKSETFRIMLNNLKFRPTFKGADYIDFAHDAYQSNPYVYAAITQTAATCASVPPQLFRVRKTGEVTRAIQGYDRKAHADSIERHKLRRTARRLVGRKARKIRKQTGAPYPLARAAAQKKLIQTGELEPIESHELLDLLDRPNPWYQTSYNEFITNIVSYLEIGGMTFIEPKKANGRPRELYVLSPEDAQPIKGNESQPIAGFEFKRKGKTARYRFSPDPEQTEIFYIRYFHPRRPIEGMSPVEAAALSVDVNNEGRRWNLSLLQNGALLSGIITAKGSLGPAGVQQLRDQFNRRHQGANNAAKVLAIDGAEGIDWKPTSATVRDMMWAQLNKATSLEVSIVWQVPPEILGDSTRRTYSNYSQARRAFYLEKIIPLMDFIYGHLNSQIVPLYGDDLFLDYDLEAVDALQEDVAETHKRVRQDVQSGMITINEARDVIGRDEIDGGDVILVPSSHVPLETALQGGQPEPDPDEPDEPVIDEPVGDGQQNGQASLTP